jgi:hypothetical protein
MKLLTLKSTMPLEAFFKSIHVINHGTSILYVASQEIAAMLERQKQKADYPDCEVVRIMNPNGYTFVLLDTYDFDFRQFFENVDERGNHIPR